jgi:hypothetical protein
MQSIKDIKRRKKIISKSRFPGITNYDVQIRKQSGTIPDYYIYDPIVISNVCFNNIEIIGSKIGGVIGFEFYR